jgi:hypothetical protein
VARWSRGMRLAPDPSTQLKTARALVSAARAKKEKGKMTRSMTSRFGLCCSSLVSIVAVGCAGHGDDSRGEAGPSGHTVTNEDELRLWGRPWRPRPPAAGATGGAPVVTPPPSGTGGTGNGGSPASSVDCGVCATAQACCVTVKGGPLCTFSEETCESMESVRRAAYVGGCKTLLTTTRNAWKGNPPSECW